MKTIYKEELKKSMEYMGSKDDVIFIGQQIVFRGNPMSTTIENVSKDKMIETPVLEEVQMGMSTGLAISGYCVVSFYPRWDFLICGTNQLVTHLDNFKKMTGYDAHVIVRVGKGSDTPLDPGPQHKSDYSEQFKELLEYVEVVSLKDKSKIYETYINAYKNKKPIIITEYPELYDV